MDNNYNNVGPVAPQPAPAPAPKSHAGLIIGLIVLLLVVVGGFLAAFFLYIKPNFIDGGGSSGEEKEEEKTWSDIYASYLKKEFDDDELEISFIDFDNDDTPEMIVVEDDEVVEIDTIKKNKVSTIKVGKEGKIDLMYNVSTEKEEWFLVDTSYMSNNYYNLKDTVKDGELAVAERFDSEGAAKKKYMSLEADVKYEEVTGKTASKVAKSMAKSDNYKKEKTVSDIKKELEEMNKQHKIVCKDTSDPTGTLTYDLTFKNNLLDSVAIIMDIDAGKTLTADEEKQLKDTLTSSLGTTTATITIANTSGTKYRITVGFSVDDFLRYMNIDATKEDLSFADSDQFVKSFKDQGATCTVD